MPLKDKEKKRIYMQNYYPKYRLQLSLEQREHIRKQNRESQIARRAAMSSAQRATFYKSRYISARKNGDYDNISEEMVKAYQTLRNLVINKFGARCSSSDCRWINEDGTRGCTSRECLQVDHVNGGGRKEKEKGATLYRKVLRDAEGMYQLLCSNCNWIKRERNGEVKVSKYRRVSNGRTSRTGRGAATETA